GNATYTATFTPVLRSYTITWNNWDASQLEQDLNVLYGTAPSYDGATPTKPSTAQYDYTFAGWTPTVVPVVGNATYTATFTPVLRNYTITWNNYDASQLEQDLNVDYGTSPSYDGATPTKPSAGGYDFTFAGWTPTVVPVVGDATYTATFTPVATEYTIAYIMDGGTNNPTNPDTYTVESALITLLDPARGGFTFAGWTPTDNIPAGSTGNRTFTATWLAIPPAVDYDVFYNENGGSPVPNEFGLDAGDLVTEPSDPTRTGHDFDGWFTDNGTFNNEWDFDNDTMPASDITLHAKWIQLITITWNNWDDSLLEQDTDVPYGAIPTYDGAVPTKPSTASSDFTFVGWNPTIAPATGNATYTAQYATSGVAYIIRWEDWDGTLLEEDLVLYGVMPTFDSATPTRPDEDDTEFTFFEWSPEVVPVVGPATYTAQYTENIPRIPTPEADPGNNWLWWLMLIPGALLIWLILAFWLRVVPIVELMTKNADGTYTITWGYENRKGRKVEFDKEDSELSALEGSIMSSVLINPAAENKEVPPIVFEKGRVENVFTTIAAADSKIEWKIKSRKSVADLKKQAEKEDKE
ncbi:MAG: hypothetical protein HN389_09620, partial [Clostridia bacterium]|nr:hypothetical protein [Clostridia bacterium]